MGTLARNGLTKILIHIIYFYLINFNQCIEFDISDFCILISWTSQTSQASDRGSQEGEAHQSSNNVCNTRNWRISLICNHLC